jgi:hypothetical protein
MTEFTLTSSQYHRHPMRAVRLADSAPVFITTYGKVTTVLMSIEAFNKLPGVQQAQVQTHSMPGDQDKKVP